MIDPSTIDTLGRISARWDEVLHAYDPGFTPGSSDVAAARPRAVPAFDPLSVSLPANAYLVTAGPSGNAVYTRDGRLQIVDGQLRAADGAAVYGYPSGRAGGALAALTLDPIDAALGSATHPRIEADGTVAYTRTSVEPRSGERRSERVVAGRVALARFPAGTEPVRLDGVHAQAPRGVAPILGTPGDAPFAALHTHSRDLGGVDLARALARLQEAYQSFEAVQAAHHARGGIDKTTMDLLK